MKRTLTLKREALADLTGDELSAVAGGAMTHLSCPLAACLPGIKMSGDRTCPVGACISDLFSCVCTG